MLPELLNQIPPDQDIGSVTAPSRQIAPQSPARQWTGRMTPVNATRRLPHEMPMRSPLCSNQWRTRLALTAQECKALETDECRSCCSKRCGQCSTVSWPHSVATLVRIPPPKPRRNEDAMYETAWPIASSHTFFECVAGLWMARDFERQVAEIQIRIAVLNRYTALGIPITEPVGLVRLGYTRFVQQSRS